jgi:hypothetical protein
MSSLLSQKLSYVPVYEATSTTSLAGYDTTRGTSRRGRSLVERCVYQANEACVILHIALSAECGRSRMSFTVFQLC